MTRDNTDSKIPEIPLAVVKWLETVYPAVNPTPADSLASLMYEAGRRSVVDKLQFEFDRQQET